MFRSQLGSSSGIHLKLKVTQTAMTIPYIYKIYKVFSENAGKFIVGICLTVYWEFACSHADAQKR